MFISQINIYSFNNRVMACDTLGCANLAKAILWDAYLDPEPRQLACEQCETQARETQEFPKTR